MHRVYASHRALCANTNTVENSTYKTSSPQASQKGVLVSSNGCAVGGLVGDLFTSTCPGGLVEVGDTAAGDADVGIL